MSNPTYRHGPIGYGVVNTVDQFRLAKLVPGTKPGADVKVEFAGATGPVFGAVTERRDATNVMSAKDVAVHYGTSAVKLRVVGGDATAIKAGSPVFAAADGYVAATGTVLVGVAAWNGEDDRVLTVLNGLPAAGAV